MSRLFWIAKRGVMEILGLDPYQSETQYLEEFLRESRSGNKSGKIFPHLFPLSMVFRFQWK